MADFDDKELKKVLGPRLPDPDGSPSVRFVQHALAWHEAWLAHNRAGPAGGASAVAILVYAEAPRDKTGVPADPNFSTEPFYRQALDPASDGVIVCNENLQTMLRVRRGLTSIDQAFAFVEQHLSLDQAFVVIPFSQPRMLYHLPGQPLDTWCADPTRVAVDPSKSALITPDLIAATVHQFATDNLKFPTAPVAARVWLDGKPYLLSKWPENLIQSFLLIHLRAYYRCSVTLVDEEVRTPGGRADLRIARLAANSAQVVTTVMELKVLSAKKSFDGNVQWGLKGIEQADSYRTSNTDAAFAWLFDARKKKLDILPNLKSAADTANVRLELSTMLAERPSLKTAAKAKGPASRKKRA